MSGEIKAIRVVSFSGKKQDWDGWSEKFLARAKMCGYKRLMTVKEEEAKEGVDKIPKVKDLDTDESTQKDTVNKLVKLNEMAYADLVLAINTETDAGKVAFKLVKNSKNSDYPEGNCNMAWSRLTAKYAPRTAPSLLKLKREFNNSSLENVRKDPDVWILKLESLQNEMEEIGILGKLLDDDFMIHVLNNLPKEYDVVVDNLESKLCDEGNSKLTIEQIREKLNGWYKKFKTRNFEKEEGEGTTKKALKASG